MAAAPEVPIPRSALAISYSVLSAFAEN